MWNHGTHVYVRLEPNFGNKVCGLCGNYDGNTMNDFMTRQGIRRLSFQFCMLMKNLIANFIHYKLLSNSSFVMKKIKIVIALDHEIRYLE